MHESVCGNLANYSCNLLDYESFLPLIPSSGIIKPHNNYYSSKVYNTKNNNEFEMVEDSLTEVNY